MKVFRGAEGPGLEVARKVLLGHPPEEALRPMLSGESQEVAMLAGLAAAGSHGSARRVGARGERLSATLERWLRAKEARAMEQKVMQTRGYIMSAVMGAVTAMLASLGPLVSNLNFLSPPQAGQAAALPYGAAALCGISSAMLGLFMSERRFYVNVAITLGVFALTMSAVAPLANVPAVSLWGLK